jgi:outer membrane lipopolysaccharide assembly protein LptE/RlpB
MKIDNKSSGIKTRRVKIESIRSAMRAGNSQLAFPTFKLISYNILLMLLASVLLVSCKVYSFKDVTIPPEVKTIKIGFIENKARYVNPQISPRLTDRIQQKINNQTRLTRTTSDDAHYQVSGYISQYDVTTSGISGQQAAINRLTVSAHITFRNTLANTSQEFDVSRNFDFNANLTLQQAEGSLTEEILRNLTDEIFNRLFSNW